MLSLTLTAFAGEVVKVGDVKSPVQVTVLQSSEDRIVVKFEIGSFFKNAVEINGKSYYFITAGKDHYVSPAGTPVLPRVSRSVLISDTGSAQVNVISSEYKDFVDVPVAPSKGNLLRTVNPADVPYEFGPVYTSGEWYPETLASVRSPYILRDHRATVIDVNAFQYNSYRDTLRVYTSVVVELIKVESRGANELIRSRAPQTVAKDFDLIYNSRFINYNDYKTNSRYRPVPEEGGMLIICNDAWTGNMEPFITHKKARGMAVEMVAISTIGNDSTKIKSYIQNY
jgi:gingipain R